MQIGTISVENPLFLAPMAGVTDWAFRTVCAQLGAGVTITEMVSSRALVYKDKKTAKLLRKNEGSICGAQIFGNDPATMAEGAKLALEISGCDFIDINMGCPMPKIANSGDGSGLMRTPELAGEILRAVCAAVPVPVTVKCRLGWDKGSINVLDFTKRMEDSGAAMSPSTAGPGPSSTPAWQTGIPSARSRSSYPSPSLPTATLWTASQPCGAATGRGQTG